MSAVMEATEQVEEASTEAVVSKGKRILARETAGNLLKMVEAVSGVISGATVLPILSNVLLTKSGTELRAKGSDLTNELEVITSFGNPDECCFATSVAARKLVDILKSFSSTATVRLELQGLRLVVASGSSRLSLQTQEASDFPVSEAPVDLRQAFMTSQKVLKRLLKSTAYAMADRDIRAFLNGVLLCSEHNGTVRTVATNGHRLVVDSASVEGSKGAVPVIIPRKAITELLRLLKDVDDMVRVNISDRMATFCLEGDRSLTLTTKLLEGKYPDWKRVIPTQVTQKVTVDRAELLAAVRRSALLGNDKVKAAAVRFEADGSLAIKVEGDGESAEDRIPMEGWKASDSVEIGFNLAYLGECVGNMVGDTVTIGVRSATESIVMRDSDCPELRAVLMPMRL